MITDVKRNISLSTVSDAANLKRMSKSAVDKLLDQVETVLKRRKLSVKAFARELGYKTQGSYVMVVKWLRQRCDNPNGENILKLRNWLDKQKIK